MSDTRPVPPIRRLTVLVAERSSDDLPPLPSELVSYFNADSATCASMEELIREYARATVLQEMERCAKLCDSMSKDWISRGRTLNWEYRAHGAEECAAAIRLGASTEPERTGMQSPPEGGEGLANQKGPRERCPSKQSGDCATLRDALQMIADMDPHQVRADDLGRAASLARAAIRGTTSHPNPTEQG